MTHDSGKKVHKPDLRTLRWQQGLGRQVRIELEIPDNKVLLSCFDGWHGPLNNRYLAWDEEEEEAFDAAYDAIRPQKYTLWELHKICERKPRPSWAGRNRTKEIFKLSSKIRRCCNH